MAQARWRRRRERFAGVAPVKITVDGRDLWVAPEVAEAHNQGKPGAFDVSRPCRSRSTAKWKWVHPEVAAAEMELDAAEQEKKNLEENRQIAVVARDGYSFALKQPVKIFADEESAAKEEARLQYTYLEEDRDNALANYQLQFKSLYEQGYTEDFRQVEDLNSEVTKIFDLDTTTEEGRESLEKITEEVSDIAGEDARIRAVPMFFHRRDDDPTESGAACRSGRRRRPLRGREGRRLRQCRGIPGQQRHLR